MYIGGDVVGLPVWDIRCVGEVKGHVEEIRLVEAELNGNNKKSPKMTYFFTHFCHYSHNTRTMNRISPWNIHYGMSQR